MSCRSGEAHRGATAGAALCRAGGAAAAVALSRGGGAAARRHRGPAVLPGATHRLPAASHAGPGRRSYAG